jgi:pimeloyl-ACP methyl ester carboxylesterase
LELVNVSLVLAQTPKGDDQGYITLDDGIRLFYQKVGNGPITIIIPNGQSMLKDFKQFAGRNYTLIFYDLRSRGRSNRATKIFEGGVHLEVEDLDGVRRHFKIDKATLIGHSYLGLVVALYAMKYPMHVEQVIQIGAAQPQGNKEYPPHLRVTDPIPPDVNDKIVALVKSEPIMDPKEFCRQYFKIVSVFYIKNSADWEKVVDACEYSNEWPTNLSKHISANITPSLKAISVTKAEAAIATMKILTIQGSADRAVPYGAGRDGAFLLPQARLLTIEGGSHFPWIEAPEKVFGAIRKFLDGQWPDGAEQITKVDPKN